MTQNNEWFVIAIQTQSNNSLILLNNEARKVLNYITVGKDEKVQGKLKELLDIPYAEFLPETLTICYDASLEDWRFAHELGIKNDLRIKEELQTPEDIDVQSLCELVERNSFEKAFYKKANEVLSKWK